MTQLYVICPNCGHERQIDPQLTGGKLRCHRCHTTIVSPPPSGVPLPTEDSAADGATPDQAIPAQSADSRRLAPAFNPPTAVGETVREVQTLSTATQSPGPVPVEWRPGDLILNLYEVQRVFESGGMGLVYQVSHRGWNLPLAVKSPRADFFKTEQDKLNFEREAETWVNLGLHPHIVSCHYVRRLGGIPRVFAEFMEGGSLKDWIDSRTLYAGGSEAALQRIIDIAIQFAWGLQYAHDQQLVHQDVKPANVLMTQGGIAKVSDFGLANSRGGGSGGRDHHLQATMLVTSGGLTPAYCSPEQSAGRPLSRRTDLWSWAVSVLEMFTGEVTWYSGVAAGEALENHIAAGHAEDSEIPQMPTTVAELLKNCFDENPDQRPRDMGVVALSLCEIYAALFECDYPRSVPTATRGVAANLNNRAASLIDLNKEEEAAKIWEQALQDDPHHIESTFNLSIQQWRSGEIDDLDVVQSMREVSASSPGESLPELLLAQFHLERGATDESLELLQSLAAQNADPSVVNPLLEWALASESSSRRCIRSFRGHSDAVNAVAFNSTADIVLSGGSDRTLRLWNAATGEELRCMQDSRDSQASSRGTSFNRLKMSRQVSFRPDQAHSSVSRGDRPSDGNATALSVICLSSDGTFAISGGSASGLKHWNLSSGTCDRIYEGHTSTVSAAAISSDDRLMISGSWDKTLRLWDIETGQCLQVFEGHSGIIKALDISRDGRHALSGSWDKSLKLWDLESGQCLQTFVGHTALVKTVCLSSCGLFALSGGDDNTVKLWDTKTGTCLRTFTGHRDFVLSVQLSHDRKFAVSASRDSTIRLWNVQTGCCLRTFSGHTHHVNSVRFSDDSRFLMSAGSDRVLKLWDLSPDWDPPGLPLALCRIVTSESIRSADIAEKKLVQEAVDAVRGGHPELAVAPLIKARSVAHRNRMPTTVQLWSELYLRLPRRGLQSSWQQREFEGHRSSVNTVCFSNDAQHAVSGSDDGNMCVWSVPGGSCVTTIQGFQGPVSSVSFSRDSRLLAAAGNQRTISLWEMPSGRCLNSFDLPLTPVSSVRLSGNSRFLVCNAGYTLVLLDAVSGTILRSFEGHTNEVLDVDLSSDSCYAVSGSTDRTVRVWDVATGKCVRLFEEHAGAVNAVRFSTDGRYVLSASDDGTLKRWHLAGNRCLRTFEGHQGAVRSVCAGPDSQFAITGGQDQTVKLWNLISGRCLKTLTGHTAPVRSVRFSADARYALSAGTDRSVRLWFMDWDLDPRTVAPWDDGARPWMIMFLNDHVPFSDPASSGKSVKDRHTPAHSQRQGTPVWSDTDFAELLQTLGAAGYGWLDPYRVRRELESMTVHWDRISTID